MVASKIKSCSLCKKDCEKLFKPNEKVLGKSLSIIIKLVLNNQQIEFPQKFCICIECTLEIIQTEIILKRLTETLINNKPQNHNDGTKAKNDNDKQKVDVEKNENKKGYEDVKNKTISDSIIGEWKFDCKLCDYITKAPKLYKTHLSSKHDLENPRIYQCMYCTESYQRRIGIQNHIAHVHENKPKPQRQRSKSIAMNEPLLSSTTIEEKLTNKASDNNTVEEVTKLTYKFECDHCEYDTTNAKVFKKHLMNKHQVEEARIYKCKMCSLTYQREYALQNHISYKHENKQRPIPQRRKSVPPDFELSTTMSKNLVGEVSHEVQTSNKLRCERCSYKTNKLKNLKSHMVITHQIDDISKNECLVINDSDNNHQLQKPQENSLNEITLNDMSLTDWTFRCAHCNFESTERKIYKSHMRNQHGMTDENIYKCIHCAGTYKRYNLLQSHVQNKHSINLTSIGDTPANYSKSNKDHFNGLNERKRRIENEGKLQQDANREPNIAKRAKIEEANIKRKEACMVCGKQFSQAEKLRAHIDKHHGGTEITDTGERKNIDTKSACQYPGCAKRFNKLAKMQQHMSVKHPNFMS